eukprot:768631-Hanusia_phi.AAC.4
MVWALQTVHPSTFTGVFCDASNFLFDGLLQFYTQMKQLGKPFEVVFLSCDRDSKSFSNYFGHMPWLAVPFDSDKRENALGALQVEGIPKLVIVGANGMVLQDNAVGTPLNAQKLDSWIAGRP